MNEAIKKAIENGRLVLLLGAGASLTSKDRHGNKLLDGYGLAKLLATEAGFTYNDENLKTAYSAAVKVIGNRVNEIIQERYKHCIPSVHYKILARYPWARIYTLNIDDALDNAFRSDSDQMINIRYLTSRIVNQDALYEQLDIIKLNGSIDRLEDGLIFSAQEYGSASATPPLWYRELGSDYFHYTFLFIGTKLEEPLFYHHVERFKNESKLHAQKAYIITRSASDLEKASLDSYNIEHIAAEFSAFCEWLTSAFPSPPSKLDLAASKNPSLKYILNIKDKSKREEYRSALNELVPVSRHTLISSQEKMMSTGKIKDFYKGFKPTWYDIVEGVPAELRATREFYELIKSRLAKDKKLVALIGPAGSGKSTLLRQCALRLSDETDHPIYYIDSSLQDLKQTIYALESSSNEKYVLFVERIDFIVDDLKEILSSGLLHNGLVIGAESQNVWDHRVKSKVSQYSDNPYILSTIDSYDAKLILEKVKKYGAWTRLKKLSQQDRINELLEKARRQLLIGLLEATSGDGFEKIIENDYKKLSSRDEKLFLILVGLATIHRSKLKKEYLGRSLLKLKIHQSISHFETALSGIVVHTGSGWTARHPTYVRHLFESSVDQTDLSECIKALLHSYTVYEVPVIKNLHKSESKLFKAIINNRFLRDMFSSNPSIMLGIYEEFEKYFESDGLYWLQYGLALRGLGMHAEALEKLKTAIEAYPQAHTEHALAQQELIIAASIDSKTRAYDLIESARQKLERLDSILDSDDTYPIVTLSEGHTKALIKLNEKENARKIAKYYIEIIQQRLKKNPHEQRLKNAWSKLSMFITSDIWSEVDEYDYF